MVLYLNQNFSNNSNFKYYIDKIQIQHDLQIDIKLIKFLIYLFLTFMKIYKHTIFFLILSL